MSVYKFAINGEEHDIQWSWWEVQSPLTAWDWIDITNNVVSNTWVLSVNGKDWNVEITDFLSTSKTNAPFTPSKNYDPATKKYVDDNISWAVSKWSTAPSSPVEWQLWYDTTNDVLKSYNWTAWVEVWWWIKNNTTWTTYTLQEEWVWEESQFNQLSNFWNIIYNVIE